jgi:hypothetical protein
LASAVVGAACVALAGMAFTRLAAPEAIWSPRVTDDSGFSPTDPVVVQEHWPTLGTSTGLGAVIAETALALEADEGGLAPTSIAVAAGACAVLVCFATIRRLGARLLPAAAGSLGLAFGGVFWSRAASGQPAIYGALFGLAAVGALVWWADTRRGVAAVSAAASLGLAIAMQPASALAVPFVLAFVWMHGARTRERAAVSAALVAGAAAGGAAAWTTLAASGARLWLLPRGFDTVIARLPGVGGAIVSDFGVLGLGFLIVGATALVASRPRALWLLAGWPAGVALGGLLWAAPDWRATALLAVAAAWVLAGVGMERLLAARRFTGAALVVLVPLMSFAGNVWTGARARTAREFVAQYLGALGSKIPPDAVVVAEGGAIDRAMMQLAVGGETVWQRVAQDPARLNAILESGRPAVAFSRAQTNLEALGFRFRPVAGAGVPMAADRFIDTVPAGWIVAVAAGKRFGEWLPPTRRRVVFDAVGGTLPTFGMHRSYALIGVKGRRGPATEHSGVEAEAAVQAGDRASETVRWPATLRAVSTGDGALVEYDGQIVAATKSGLALAVVSSTGALAGAFAAEFTEGMQLRVNPAQFAPAMLEGREPCRPVDAGRWTDVSPLALLSSLGALLDPGQRLVIWLAGPNLLAPRLQGLPRIREPVISFRHFDVARGDERAALRTALAREQIDEMAVAAAMSAAYALRIEVVPPDVGRSVLALRLGGSARVALARLASHEAAPGTLCSPMYGKGFFAWAVGETAAEDFDLADSELLPYGWHRLEHIGPRHRRWTRAPRAEILVPLARAGAIDIEITIEPAVPVGTMADLSVNDIPVGRQALRPGVHTYRWVVPGDAWREGMNLVTLGSSAMVRPSDVGVSRDDRELGLAVSAIRFRVTGWETSSGASGSPPVPGPAGGG